jgi:hypothetical protein
MLKIRYLLIAALIITGAAYFLANERHAPNSQHSIPLLSTTSDARATATAVPQDLPGTPSAPAGLLTPPTSPESVADLKKSARALRTAHETYENSFSKGTP